ncbi:uncharacterized protein LOC112495593 [Citrus sinensis]|uniref:uncharacterized protein LOC112495593 n=1 Tax=Citrus sinensis TaxID=2711 RepID=UPI00227955B8|nr:uncharacterized protein LOC112495593 [Citrus sinensis]
MNKTHTHTAPPNLDKSLTHTLTRFAGIGAAGAAGSCWNCLRCRKSLDLLALPQAAGFARAAAASIESACGCCSCCHCVHRVHVWLLLALSLLAPLLRRSRPRVAIGHASHAIQATTTQAMRGSSQASNQSCHTNL